MWARPLCLRIVPYSWSCELRYKAWRLKLSWGVAEQEDNYVKLQSVRNKFALYVLNHVRFFSELQSSIQVVLHNSWGQLIWFSSIPSKPCARTSQRLFETSIINYPGRFIYCRFLYFVMSISVRCYTIFMNVCIAYHQSSWVTIYLVHNFQVDDCCS